MCLRVNPEILRIEVLACFEEENTFFFPPGSYSDDSVTLNVARRLNHITLCQDAWEGGVMRSSCYITRESAAPVIFQSKRTCVLWNDFFFAVCHFALGKLCNIFKYLCFILLKTKNPISYRVVISSQYRIKQPWVTTGFWIKSYLLTNF